jgi:hypothetical protein
LIGVLLGLEAIEGRVRFGWEQDHERGAEPLAAADVDSAARLGHDAL